MPHQDPTHLHQNLRSFQASLDKLFPEELTTYRRHGNATIDARSLVRLAVVCFGWTVGPLSERVKTTCAAVERLWSVDAAVSRQGLLKALTSCDDLLRITRQHCIAWLSQLKGYWTCGKKVNIAVDGTKFQAPRTAMNQQAFATSRPRGRKSRRRKPYRKSADAAKAGTVQLLLTVFWHIGTGLPLAWRIQPSHGSERGAVAPALAELPPQARLIGDAEYVGYPLWSAIILSGRSFLFRVGSNITFLKHLGHYKTRPGCVFFWPQKCMQQGLPPIRLRLITLHNGRHPVYLVTNELHLSERLAGDLYRQRWGVEVFFRTVKQSCQRAKLVCTTPEHAVLELDWTLLGIWCTCYLGRAALYSNGEPPQQLSPIKTQRCLQVMFLTLSLGGPVPLLAQALKECLLADESQRTTSKRSRNYPAKKRHRRCRPPRIIQPTQAQLNLAGTFDF